MENSASFEGKIVEINDKLNYYILAQTLFNNTIYLFGNELIDEDTPSENVAILKVINQPDSLGIAYENDENIQQELLPIFSKILVETETIDE